MGSKSARIFVGILSLSMNKSNKNHKYWAKTAILYEIILIIFLTGFSGVLFALKVVNSYHSHRSVSNVMMMIMSNIGLSEKAQR